MNKALFFTAFLTTINYTTQTTAEQCIPQDIERYEVDMSYVGYDTLTGAELPPREGFNKNERHHEDQALEYRDENDDIIITIKQNVTEETTNTGQYISRQIGEVQILDDTGLYASHFLLQDLIRQATENGETEIDPKDDKYKNQIARLTQQLKKLKKLVNEVATIGDMFEVDAEDIEDNIGDEWLEGDGVLDVLDQNPVNIIKLSKIWATLLQNTSDAKDINIQAYVRTVNSDKPYDRLHSSVKSYSPWEVLELPGKWQYISTENLVPTTLINASNNKAGLGIGVLSSASTATVREINRIDQELANSYFASGYDADAGPLKALTIDASRSSCHSTQEHLIVNSRIMNRPRNVLGRINNIFLKNEKKKTKDSQGGHAVQ